MSSARSRVVGQVFDIGVDILCTTVDPATGVLSGQTGDSTTQTPDSDKSEWWQHTGFTSRPATPSVGNASCQGIVLKQNDRDQIIATRDTRGTAILGNLADGETCVYASGSQARTVYKTDGSITSVTTDDNTPTGNSVFIRVDPKAISAFSPLVDFTGDAMGWRFTTWQGARFTMTGLGLPAPFNALGLNSSIDLSADTITLDAAVLQLGRTTLPGALAQAVVQAVPLQATLTLVATALANVSTVLSNLSGVFTSGIVTGTCAAAPGPIVATASFPGLAPIWSGQVANAVAAISAADTALALVMNPSATGGTATNTVVA